MPATPPATPANPWTVYPRANSQFLWVRFSLTGQGLIRKSLGTADPVQAEAKAQQLYFTLKYRAEQGEAIATVSFKKMSDQYTAQIKIERDREDRTENLVERHERTIALYLVPFFGTKSVDAITDQDIAAFKEWRKAFWITGPGSEIQTRTFKRRGRDVTIRVQHKVPSATELRSNLNILDQILRWGVGRRIMRSQSLPTIQLPQAPPNARPSFSMDEFNRLDELAIKRMRVAHPTTRADRELLWLHINVLANTGMRPTEAQNLKWGDVLGYRPGRTGENEIRDIRLRVFGKGFWREFAPRHVALAYFDKLFHFFRFRMGRPPTADDYVFCNRNGSRVGTFSNAFKQLLDFADLQTDYRGARRTTYSLRHFYISQQLQAGVSVFDLARVCGTSSDMIDKHYGHVTGHELAVRTRVSWSGNR